MVPNRALEVQQHFGQREQNQTTSVYSKVKENNKLFAFQYELHLNWNYCRGYSAPSWDLKTILIAVGVVAVALVLFCGLIYCCRKRQQRYAIV